MNGRRARRALAAVPVWASLAAIVAVSCAVRIVISRRSPAPWIFDDELVYGKLAESFGTSGSFVVRGIHGRLGLGPGYPLLISPAYALFANVPHAYAAAKAIGSLVMSLAAVPAYFIARRVLSQPLSLAAAVFAVVIPSMAYTSVIMTENAFYPAFLLCVLAFVRLLERPTLGRQIVALAAIALTYVIRAQAVTFVGALITAVIVWVLLEARTERRLDWRMLLRRLDDFRVTWVALVLAVVLAAAAQAARGKSLSSLLGAYRQVTSWNYSVGAVARWFLWHLGELDLYLGILPFAAFLVVCVAAVRRDGGPELRAFATVSAALTLWLVLSAAGLSSHLEALDGIGRIEERNVFYVAPLMLIALLVWAERGMSRHRWTTISAAVVAGALPATIPYARFVNLSALSDTLALIPLARRVLTGQIELGHVRMLVIVGSALAALLFAVLPRRVALLAPVAVLVWLLGWQTSLNRQIRGTSRGLLASTVTVRRDWIDRAVGSGSSVSALWTGAANPVALKENEFFNHSVDRVYSLPTAPPLGGTLPTQPTSLGQDGTLVDSASEQLRDRFVLTDSSVSVVGTPVAADPTIGFTLYRTAGPPRLRSVLQGRYGDGWTGAVLTDTIYRCKPSRVLFLFTRYPGLVRGPQTIVARVNGRPARRLVLAASRKGGAVATNVRPDADGRCGISYEVTPVASPSEVLGVPDPRVLGVHVDLLRILPKSHT